jgi:hypothetical protein
MGMIGWLFQVAITPREPARGRDQWGRYSFRQLRSRSA